MAAGSGASRSGTRFVLDTGALLNGAWDRAALDSVLPGAVVRELAPGGRDHARLERLLAAGLEVRDPAPTALARVTAAARRLGESRLSAADLEVAALLLELTEAGAAAVAITDDYALQNLLAHLGLKHAGAAMRGITEARRYALRCTGCGRWFPPDGAQKEGGECPVCGAAVARRRARE
jgi:endoribonuclease Nob1